MHLHLILLALFATQDTPKPPDPIPTPKPTHGLDTVQKRGGYGLGIQIGLAFGNVDLESLRKGIEDSLAGNKQLLTDEEITAAITELQKTRAAEKGKAAREMGIAFLEKNTLKEGVFTTKSGLQYKIIKPGDGAKPGPTDKVTVHYHGTLITGEVFDSSVERKSPATFALDRVIKGWTEGVQLMSIGAKYTFYVPTDLAYGDRGPSPKIPPGATLIFEVELFSIAGK